MSDSTQHVVDKEALEEEGYRQMAAYLETLLTRQIERIRKYDLDTALELGEEANKLAYELGKSDILKRPEYSDEKFRIQRLYKEIGLIISSERQEVADKLKQIRKGIKALELYGENE
jgi:hypothetical protein